MSTLIILPVCMTAADLTDLTLRLPINITRLDLSNNNLAGIEFIAFR